MDLKNLQKNWNELGKIDPLWSILTATDKKGNQWEIDDFFEEGKKEIETLLKYIQALGINFKHGKSLDFGCGVGRLTQALAPHFQQVYGVDIAPSMIELANQYNRYGSKCSYFLNETEELKLFDDNCFDFIYTNITLQHMKPEYSKNYLKEFLRILSPNGLLIFQIPSEQTKYYKTRQKLALLVPAFLLEGYRRLRYGKQEPIEAKMEMYGVKREEVRALISDNGGKILDIKRDESLEPFWESFQYCVTKG
jgi:ubiquinone/menaquinone biosynthesis C-methylase UbiE